MTGLWRPVTTHTGPLWTSALRAGESLQFAARLPSSDEGLWFTADFQLTLHVSVWGRRRQQHTASTARLDVLEFAREQTRRYSVADAGLAEAELWQALLAEDVIADPDVRAGSITVSLTAEDEDVELVRERERCLPKYAVKLEEHDSQMRYLRRLTEEVYSDPALTLRWWYDQNPQQTRDLDMAEEKLRLVAASDYEASGGSSAVEIAGSLLVDLLRGLRTEDRDALLQRLETLFCGFGRNDLAKRLRGELTDTTESDASPFLEPS